MIAACTTLAEDLSRQYQVKISIRCADIHGRDLTSSDRLRRRKLQVALARIGLDVAVIAGAPPGSDLRDCDLSGLSLDHGDRANNQRSDLIALRDVAATRLAEPAVSDSTQRDRVRRVLSAAGSAARIVAANLDDQTPLRLPAAAHLLRTRFADNPMSAIVDSYDAFRRDGAQDLSWAAALTERVPEAIDALIALTSLGVAHSHATSGD